MTQPISLQTGIEIFVMNADGSSRTNGNFVDAEMVKAFILSSEYRHRFAP